MVGITQQSIPTTLSWCVWPVSQNPFRRRESRKVNNIVWPSHVYIMFYSVCALPSLCENCIWKWLLSLIERLTNERCSLVLAHAGSLLGPWNLALICPRTISLAFFANEASRFAKSWMLNLAVTVIGCSVAGGGTSACTGGCSLGGWSWRGRVPASCFSSKVTTLVSVARWSITVDG